jgi:hypothetical protein
MKTIHELFTKLLQLSQEHQKNITILSKHHERLEHYLSAGKKKDKFKYEVSGDVDTSYHEGILAGEFLEVHASTHVEGLCNEVEKTSSSNISLDISYDVDKTNTCDGKVESTYHYYDDYDELCVELCLEHSSSSIVETQSSMEAIP